jgi:sugar phosphate isomerase/epimerase
MKIGINSDSLDRLSLDDVLALAQRLGLDCIEFPTGAWSSAPHVDLDLLLNSGAARDELIAQVRDHGLVISALTCNGNQLHPGPTGTEHDTVTRKTIALAARLGVGRVILMSGLPAAPGDRYPNWVTVGWPPETATILEHQWGLVTSYWRELARYAADHGVTKLCVEMHAHQVVYNVPTLLRLRDAVGSIVGANYDPSHLMWMGADPIAAIGALGDAIYHVHAKDTRMELERQALTSRLETRPSSEAALRSWNYVTLGHGHDEAFWRAFCAALGAAGYHDVLSIEHEDVSMEPVEAVTESVDLLRRVALTDVAS